MAAIIECENLIKIHKQGSLEVVALQGLDFSMDEGEFISIVGKSGAGKSSLLKILAGLDRPFSNWVRDELLKRRQHEGDRWARVEAMARELAGGCDFVIAGIGD